MKSFNFYVNNFNILQEQLHNDLCLLFTNLAIKYGKKYTRCQINDDLWPTWSVGVVRPPDGTCLELHLVLCQRASFVGENVLDLTQILCDVEGPAFYSLVHWFVVELDVIVYKVHLT